MKDKEFVLRSISSVFIILTTVLFIYIQNIFVTFSILLIVSLFMAYEWNTITINAENKKFLGIVGIGYIFFNLMPILVLKELENGNNLLMWLFLLVWSEDTFAYIVGAKLKLNKHKITKISPKKSYEGLFGGMIAACGICYLFANYFLSDLKVTLLFFTPMLCVLEQCSDITESYFKRKFNVKDSGDWIPGHGGFLDRFDGFLYTTIMLICLIVFA